MKEYVSLKILDLAHPLFERLGCDYAVMRKIVKIKLTMDGRRTPTILAGSARRESARITKEKNTFLRSLWLYALMGLITVPFVLIRQNYVFQMSTTFAVLMFLIMMSMISDFSSVLLDIRDRIIIGTRPVHRRTLSFARLVHIVIYLFLLTGSMTAIPLVVALIAHGVLFFLVFVIDIILMDILIVVLTALLYLVILRVFDGERLKDIINMVQIALSIVILVGYQFVGRSFEVLNLQIQFRASWWQFFLPPIWFGSDFVWLTKAQRNSTVLVFSIAAVVLPLVLLAVYIRLMPSFERLLQKLAMNGVKTRTKAHSVMNGIARIVCRSEDERAFFRFSSLIMSKEREFKLKVYPSLGFALVFPFIFMLNMLQDHGFSHLSSTRMYLSIYASGFLIPSVVMMLRYSAQYKAAWVYKVMPIQSFSPVFKGTIKAFLARLFFPLFLLESIIFTWVFGAQIIPDLIDVFLAMLLFTVLSFRLIQKALPFSDAFQVVQQSERFIIFPLMLILGLLAGIHYGATLIPFGVYLYMAVLVLVNIVAWNIGLRVNPDRVLVLEAD